MSQSMLVHLAELLEKGLRDQSIQESDLTNFGFRILRGAKDSDFETMTDTPETRRIIQLAPLSGSGMLGKTGYQMLLHIGYGENDIEHYLKNGKKFKMVIFELNAKSPAKRATWVNVMEAMKKAYPEISILQDHVKLAHIFRGISFESFERMFGSVGSFEKIKKLGVGHPLFLTLNVLTKIQEFEKEHKLAIINASHIRLWMYLAMNFNSLFSGDGTTWTSDGQVGVEELVMANAPLKNLGNYRLFDLKVELP